MNSTKQDSQQNNLIMFPKTVDYYQIKLTRMLETEQYQEAIELLHFLLQTQGNEREAYQEWETLLEWLENQFSHYSKPSIEDEEEEEESLSEVKILGEYVQGKIEKDDEYVEKLIHILLEEVSLEKKLLALEQISFVKDKTLIERLRTWLENEEVHPLVLFKALQTLKSQGAYGIIHIQRNQDILILRIEETPVGFEDYPESMQQVLERVKEISEINHPTLSYFAEQTWKEMLSFIYGTSLYKQLLEISEKNLDVCAAVLHYISLELMEGPPQTEDLLGLYGISKKSTRKWEEVYLALKKYMNDNFYK